MEMIKASNIWYRELNSVFHKLYSSEACVRLYWPNCIDAIAFIGKAYLNMSDWEVSVII